MKSLFGKMFLSYVLILLLPLIIMGSLSYWWVVNIVADQVQQSYETVIDEAKESVDRRFKEINGFAVQMSYTPWVKKLMYMQGNNLDKSRVSFLDFNDYVASLRGYDALNDFIDTVSIILPEKDIVISSAGIANSSIFFNELYRLNETDYNKLKSYINTYNSMGMLISDILYVNQYPEKVLVYMQSIPSIDQKSHAVLMTYIKKEMLISVLKGLQISNDSSAYIIDDNGQIVVHNGQHNILQYVSVNNDGNLDKFKRVININGQKYFLFSKMSKFNKWQYVVTIPYHIVMAKVSYIKFVTILIAATLSILGLIFSYFFTSYNYNPLSELITMLKLRFCSKDPNMGEYDFLKEALSHLLDEDDLLRQQNKQQIALVRNIFFLKLLEGDKTSISVSEKNLKSIDVNFIYPNFITVLLILDEVKGINSDIHNKISYALNERYNIKIYFVEVSGDRKVAIINTDDLNVMKEMTMFLKGLVENELNVKCIAGVGKPCSLLNNISDSYRESSVAVNYRFIGDNNDIVFYEDIKPGSSVYYYPIDREEQLLNSLKTLNYEDAIAIIKSIISKNIRDYCITQGKLRCLLYELIGTALKALNDFNLSEAIKINERRIESIITFKEAEDYLIELYCEIFALLSSSKKVQSKSLKDEIKEYVDQNYMKQDTSLDSVAEAIGISPGYLSKLFKDQLGYNFLDYLNRKRIKKSKELLNGQMTIAQIAQAVGYNNDVTFRRLFKKYEGITPGEYRENEQNK